MNSKYTHMVPGKDLEIHIPPLPIALVAGVITYSAFPIFVVMDLYGTFFQLTFFNLLKIPSIKRSEYIRLDRYKLEKLTVFQKFNCLYCGYANGIVAYFKAVVNQMETYSCAIKHKRNSKAALHQKDFYEYEEFQVPAGN